MLGVGDSPIAKELLSMGSILLFLSINTAGAGRMGKAEDIAVYTKIVLLTILAVVGLFTVDPDNFRPLFDRGHSAVLLGGAVVFVAFEGFQLITNAVCEVRDPARDIPRGLYGSVAIASIIYVGIAVVAVGNLDVDAIQAAQEYALAAVARPVLGTAGVVLVDIAAMLATSSAINATIFGASHMAYEMAHEELAPRAFSFRNREGVPVRAAMVISGLAMLLATFGSLELIASFSSLTFLLVSIAVSIANLKLRSVTGSALTPILLGIMLMLATTVLLIAYLARDSTPSLVFSLCVYGLVAAAFALFETVRKRRGAA
jgi:amino acid transporter